MPEIRPYYFTDDEIDFILRLIRNNAEFEDDEEDQDYMRSLVKDIDSQIANPQEDDNEEDRNYARSLANGIEDQIVNHPEND